MTEDKRIETVRKLLTKAEDPAVTDEEREALNAKATELMIKYGIDDAVARAKTDGVRLEEITVREFSLDVPASYSNEYAVLGYRIAEVLGARPFTVKTGRGAQTNLKVVGFTSDLELIAELYASLTRQCTFALAKYYRTMTRTYVGLSGTDKYNLKRGFIVGFANGVKDKLEVIHKKAIADTDSPGTAIALRDRKRQVDNWTNSAFALSTVRGRAYNEHASGSGYGEGQRADVGQSTVGRAVPRRNAIGG